MKDNDIKIEKVTINYLLLYLYENILYNFVKLHKFKQKMIGGLRKINHVRINIRCLSTNSEKFEAPGLAKCKINKDLRLHTYIHTCIHHTYNIHLYVHINKDYNIPFDWNFIIIQ